MDAESKINKFLQPLADAIAARMRQETIWRDRSNRLKEALGISNYHMKALQTLRLPLHIGRFHLGARTTVFISEGFSSVSLLQIERVDMPEPGTAFSHEFDACDADEQQQLFDEALALINDGNNDDDKDGADVA